MGTVAKKVLRKTRRWCIERIKKRKEEYNLINIKDINVREIIKNEIMEIIVQRINGRIVCSAFT